MITLEKLKIYKYFNGDIDGWTRLATKDHKSNFKSKDWFLIENFIQDIHLVSIGLASESFLKALDENLKTCCDNEQTIEELKNMAKL